MTQRRLRSSLTTVAVSRSSFFRHQKFRAYRTSIPPKPFQNRISISELRAKKAFLIDMDGVIYHQEKIIPGAKEALEWLQVQKKDFLFITNSSQRSPRELQAKLCRMGIEVDESRFYTSALSTAAFIASQTPHGSAFVIGEPGLLQAIYDAGYVTNDVNPDFVIVGESRHYNFDQITRAVSLVQNGARLIGTNSDLVDKKGEESQEFVPACGSLIRPIEAACQVDAFFVGKPSPMMVREALKRLNSSAADSIIIGDRMDTDILGGVQSNLQTALVLTGVSDRAIVSRFAYQPDLLLDSIASIISNPK
uniref:HAD family hydrolase n=1 Tax=Hirondellea gigas TaxID=1518452 RepID=A0A6A7GAH0_9CRUS